MELCGWVHRRRDHGGVIFLDVRDRTGIVQVVYDPDTVESFAIAERVRNEYVLRMTGKVRRRQPGAENPNMATGEIEVLGKELEILNAAATPPFQLDEYSDAGEDIRLRYRYLDLRRPGDAGTPAHSGARGGRGAGAPRRARLLGNRDADAQPFHPRKARATTWCRAAPTRGASSRCPSRRRCTSSC